MQSSGFTRTPPKAHLDVTARRPAGPIAGATTAGERKLLARLMMASAAFGVFQIAIGAPPLLVMLTLVTAAVTLIPCLAYGLTRTVGIVFLLVWYQFAFGELMTKSLLLQPIDTFLFNPVLSHIVQLVGAVTLATGALAAFWIVPLRRNLIRPTLDPSMLRVLSVVFLGLFSLSFAADLAGPNGRAIAVFLRNYMLTALVMEIAATIISSGGRRSLSRWGLVLTAVVCAMSLASNSKAGILAAGLCYLMTPLALGRAPSWKFLAATAPLVILLSVAVAPAIHLVRAERDKIGPVEVLEKTVATAAGILTSDKQTLDQVESMQRQQHELTHDYYRNRYLGQETVWYDRFILIGSVDAIARRLTIDGPFLGTDMLLGQLKDVLPRQLSGPKDPYTSGTRITQMLGLTERDTALFTTVPMPIELFAAGGFLAMILIGIPSVAAACVGINLFASAFQNNVWSVYILVTYGYFLTVQNYLGYFFFSVRQLPADYIMITISTILATLMLGRAGSRSSNSARSARQTT
jgi:hypothetical protein